MTKIKERILKAAREKQQITYKGTPISLSADFSAETLQARREWHNIFKVMKGKNWQPRILYPGRLSFRFDGEIRLYRQVKAKRIQHHQTSFTTNVKGTSLSKKEKTTTRKKKIMEVAIRTYISIMTLHVNGLNVPTKRHRLAQWIQKEDLYICCLQEKMGIGNQMKRTKKD